MIYSLDLDTHSPTYVSNHHSGHSKYIRLYLSIKLRGEKDKSGYLYGISSPSLHVFKSRIQVVKYS